MANHLDLNSVIVLGLGLVQALGAGLLHQNAIDFSKKHDVHIRFFRKLSPNYTYTSTDSSQNLRGKA